MTTVFIFSALTIDWLLCEVFEDTEEVFWLDELIEDQRDSYVQRGTPETRIPSA